MKPAQPVQPQFTGTSRVIGLRLTATDSSTDVSEWRRDRRVLSFRSNFNGF
jgi:hypothetical protein